MLVSAMLSLLFIPFELFQLLASLELTHQIILRGSIYAISLDFLLYSWVWSITHTAANIIYCWSTSAQAQYAARYPLYSSIPSSNSLALLGIAQFCIWTLLAKKCLFNFKSQESLSMVCKTVLVSCACVLSWFFWLFCRHRATINILDIADCLHNIGSIALASRLIPQISLNWFLDCFPLSETFMLLQFSAVFSASLALISTYSSEIAWFELPLGSPSQAVLGASWFALAVLTCQRKSYGPKSRRTDF